MLLELFKKAALGENLTPGERAFRKLVLGVAAAALSIFFVALPDMLKSGQANVTAILSALGVALLLALAKLFSAQGDAAKAALAQAGAAKLGDFGGVSNQIVEELEGAATDATVPVDDSSQNAAAGV